VLSDIGYNVQEWNVGSLLLTVAGWVSLVYRIDAEERCSLATTAGVATPVLCAIV
jgi:hypothetical protein